MRAFCEYYSKHAAELSARDAERYLLHLQSRKLSGSTRNQCASALQFLYRVVLDRAQEAMKIPFAKKQQREPRRLTVRTIGITMMRYG